VENDDCGFVDDGREQKDGNGRCRVTTQEFDGLRLMKTLICIN